MAAFVKGGSSDLASCSTSLLSDEFDLFCDSSFAISISTKGIPVLAISPTETLMLFTTPSTDAGISIAALSVSRIIIGSSESTF